MRIIQFLALVLAALALAPFIAHLAALPNKIDLGETDYFISQNIYNGWALFGIVTIGSPLCTLALTIAVRAQRTPLLLSGFSLLCQLATLAIFFAFTFPANVATSNWTTVPADWQQLRWQWEISHATNAVIFFVGFCALVIAVITTRDHPA